MSEHSLFSALEKIHSDKIIDRKDGLTQLKSILTHSHRLSQISDKAYHKMLDAVFLATLKEKKTFTSKTKSSMTATVKSRLELCGQVLRAVVEQSVKHLKVKTFRALTQHITQLLEERRGGFTEQFSLEYAKALRIALEWSPHREHLTEEEWVRLMLFCTREASNAMPVDIDPLEQDGSSRKQTFGESVRLKTETEEFITCMALLLSTPNAPITGVQAVEIQLPGEIGDCLLLFLRTHTALTRAHQGAYLALNAMLDAVGSNQVDVAEGLATQMVPIIHRQWIRIKQRNIREQMLICLHYGLPHLKKALRSTDPVAYADTKRNLDQLVEMLLDDLKGGRDRDLLVLDDLRFSKNFRPVDLERAPLSLRNFSLRATGQAREEQNWMIPKVLAELMNILDMNAASRPPEEDPDETLGDESYAKKKTKIASYYGDLLLDVRSARATEKTAALQILAFMLEGRRLDAKDVEEVLGLLINTMNDTEGATADWAMLVAVSCGLHTSAKDLSLQNVWLQAWNVSIRSASIAGKCRTASHLLHAILRLELVPYTSIAADIEAMLVKADLSGPAGLFDSSLNLWRFIVHKSRLIAQTSTLTPGSSLVQWLLSKYRPEDSLDRHAMSYYARNVFSCDLLDFLLTACGLDAALPDSSQQFVFGEVGQAVVRMARIRTLQEYLLLEDEQEPFLVDKFEDEDTDLGAWNTQVEVKLLDFFARTSTTIRDKWQNMVSGQHSVSPEMTRNATTFLTVGAAILSLAKKREEANKIAETFIALASDMKAFILSAECTQPYADAALDAIIPIIPNTAQILSGEHPLEDLYFGHFGTCVTFLAEGFLKKEQLVETAANGSPDEDSMDIDDEMGMGEIRTRSDKVEGTLPEREDLQISSSLVRFRTASTTLLSVFSQVVNSISSINQEALLASIAQLLMDLPTEKMIYSRTIILDFLTAKPNMPIETAANLLEHVGGSLLQQYEFERFEPAILLCTDMLSVVAEKWVPLGSHLDYTEFCQPCYEFLIRITMEKKFTSYSVRIATANLLKRILTIRHDYSLESTDAPNSARTYFIQLLSDPDIRVKAHMSECLPYLLDLVTVNCHPQVYKDIHEYLPKNDRYIEDMAIRLYVLSNLRSESLNTRKSIIFHMFETAQFPEVIPHASRSLTKFAKTLGMKSSSELLELYSGQIIFTWINTYVLDTIPFQVAGYKTLRGLYKRNKAEIFAQLLYLKKIEEVEDFCDKIKIPFSQMARESFAKTMAYGLAYTAQQSTDKRETSVEILLRERLGEEEFDENLTCYGAAIAAELFNHMEQDGTSLKVLNKLENHSGPAETMRLMTEISHSQATYADSLKPSFKSRGILPACIYLSKTLRMTPQQFWSAPMLVYVVRTLLDSIHPAFGRIHTIGIIRNIRLVVALAGETAHSGYPLEMIVHGLRPYIFDSLSAEDTVGIIQYLLSQGRSYVVKKPAFMAGTFISVLSTLKAFLSTSQESSVEETQFQSSQSSAQSFWRWLESFIAEYKSKEISDAKNELLREIAQLALGFRPPGNAKPGSKEGRLLQLLIRDENSSRPLLDEVSQGMAFRLLARGFERPESFRTDMLQDDRDSIRLSKVLLRICKKFDLGKEFLLWAGRVLGRAYAASGEVYPEWTQESFFKDRPGLPDTGKIDTPTNAAILDVLCGLLLSDDKKVVSLAESTLIEIICSEGDPDTPTQESEISSLVLLPKEIYAGLKWTHPPNGTEAAEVEPLSIQAAAAFGTLTPEEWMRRFAMAVVSNTPQDPIARRLTNLLKNVDGLARKLLPYIVHSFLIDCSGAEGEEDRKELSSVVRGIVRGCTPATAQQVAILLKTVIYMRSQPRRNERTKLERDDWLELDYLELARAASVCGMYKTALLFAEIHYSRSISTPRRGQVQDLREVPPELLLDIYRHIDEPDAFYGVTRRASFASIMDDFSYERAGWKSLAFHSAALEASLRLSGGVSAGNAGGLVDASNDLGFAGMAMMMLRNDTLGGATEGHQEKVLRSAWELGQWDLPCPPMAGGGGVVYKALQQVNVGRDLRDVAGLFDAPVLDVMRGVVGGREGLARGLRDLAILAESEEVFGSRTERDVEEVVARQEGRLGWMVNAPFARIDKILAARQVTFGSLAKRVHLQKSMGLTEKAAKFYEAKATIGACKMTRKHEALSHSLTAAMKLSALSEECKDSGLHISGIARLQEANVLWGQGEASAAIGILKALDADTSLETQNIGVNRVKLLAKLGKWVAQARYEKPDVIINNYLSQAIKQLGTKTKGSAAGSVYHEFAVFCDNQLKDPGNVEDLNRLKRLRDAKKNEVQEWNRIIKEKEGKVKDSVIIPLISSRKKTEAMFALDEEEYRRLARSQQDFLKNSISNYLRCLAATDDYESDTARFCALWLEHYNNEGANSAARLIQAVPSWKFTTMVNQLSSRLQATKDTFQPLLQELMYKICKEHPYHALYQLHALKYSKVTDQAGILRNQAAKSILARLTADPESSRTAFEVEDALLIYDKAACLNVKEKVSNLKKSRQKATIGNCFPRDLREGFDKKLINYKRPSPSTSVAVRPDCDYSNVPYIEAFYPEISIANGLSAPKIMTAKTSDGHIIRMLVKSGNDDLRQDSIMEQVFEQVSKLLQRSRVTRQRNLQIRTYNVIPFTERSGMIEFVPNTTPLHEYLLPAHDKYHPHEWKQKQCRDTIAAVVGKSREERVKAYKQVCAHFKPVMRYWFMHNFNGPDEWFEARLRYTRSTAAISILGHVLGLGDRHGHNILLDQSSGEVVHIDLGVAFEQGRVLPIPEVVPFRLTRDIVDGMGITKTEGVFRRCCEFTLSILRDEAHYISTILDVLRYDPLYTWSQSPVRLRRIQENQAVKGADNAESHAPTVAATPARSTRKSIQKEELVVDQQPIVPFVGGPQQGGSEEAEAERALLVVAKKLSKTLSVSATVNELIVQAADERNLAVLFCGWAAYI